MQIISRDDILMARRKDGYMGWCHPCAKLFFHHHCNIRHVPPRVIQAWRDVLKHPVMDLTAPDEPWKSLTIHDLHPQSEKCIAAHKICDRTDPRTLQQEDNLEDSCYELAREIDDDDLHLRNPPVLPLDDASQETAATGVIREEPYRKRCTRCNRLPRVRHYCRACRGAVCTKYCWDPKKELCVDCVNDEGKEAVTKRSRKAIKAMKAYKAAKKKA